jgi:solute carrier family 12 sodium/potassium/chloride transporter 2
LGPEFGGSIGIIFAIANAINCSLNVVGFAQAVQDMMLEYGGVIIVDGANNDIRIIGTITLIFICVICGLGAKYEAKVYNITRYPHFYFEKITNKIISTDEGYHVNHRVGVAD